MLQDLSLSLKAQGRLQERKPRCFYNDATLRQPSRKGESGAAARTRGGPQGRGAGPPGLHPSLPPWLPTTSRSVTLQLPLTCTMGAIAGWYQGEMRSICKVLSP